jgi:hypothetical protein
MAVLAGDADIEDQLELHLYPNRDPGWCLTRKTALRDAHGRIIGLTGISRDLAMADKKNPAYRKVAAAVSLIHEQYGQPLQLPELARTAYVGGADRALLPAHLPPDAAPDDYPDPRRRRLAHAQGDASVAEIAQACGYGDHSAFTRQFKATTGVTPSQYRQLAYGEVSHAVQRPAHGQQLFAPDCRSGRQHGRRCRCVAWTPGLQAAQLDDASFQLSFPCSVCCCSMRWV